jgi:UDP-N-acetyl-D-mannosaminuronic acid transferase (WecB/TagA/CpsF family)
LLQRVGLEWLYRLSDARAVFNRTVTLRDSWAKVKGA